MQAKMSLPHLENILDLLNTLDIYADIVIDV